MAFLPGIAYLTRKYVIPSIILQFLHDYPWYNILMNIVFPEFNNPIIQEALARHAEMRQTGEPIPGIAEQGVSEITALAAPDLVTACAMVKSGQADTMIAGIDYSSRDVILACKEHLGLSGHTFWTRCHATRTRNLSACRYGRLQTPQQRPTCRNYPPNSRFRQQTLY